MSGAFGHILDPSWEYFVQFADMQAWRGSPLPLVAGAKVTLDGGWAFTPVRFSNGLFGQSIAAGDWRASQTGQGTGEFVIRLQAQVLF